MQLETPPRPSRRLAGPRLVVLPLMALAAIALISLATRPLGGGPQPSFFVIGSAVPGVQIGQIAPGTAQAPASPPLSLIDLEGTPVELRDFAGQPVWIIFWKTACQPCEAEAPDIAAAYAEHRSDGLVILGINPWDAAEAVRDYASGHSISFPIAIDPTGGFMGAYGVWGAPTHYFIDSAGIIEARHFGPMTRDLIEESLHRIL